MLFRYGYHTIPIIGISVKIGIGMRGLIDILDDVSGRSGTVLDNTFVQRWAGAAGDLPRRDLEDLFPDWEAQLQR